MLQERRVIALCDDDPGFLDAFLPQVEAALAQLHETCEVLCYDSAEKLLSELREGRSLSILLLDVKMAGMDGMTLTRELRKDASGIPVIFVSSNRDCAIYGYELDALRYLAKPVEQERLTEALGAAFRKQRTQTLVLQAAEGIIRLDMRSIRYAEMQRRGIQFHLRDGAVVDTHLKISDVEQMLPTERFFRCHQGYIVSMDAIATILRAEAVLDDGSPIPVSRARLSELRQRFLSYLRET